MANTPENEWMTIPLRPDWEKLGANLAHKVYPLSNRDQVVVDKNFDKLHVQQRMEWSTLPTPFAFPVFVVWRSTEAEGKGRPVVDIRGLNRVAIADTYPMSLQGDVIAALAGSTYITTVDCTSLFYQWPVARADRHKLAVVSHRGQELFKVVIMGSKNSPTYTQRMIDRLLREAGRFGVMIAQVIRDHITNNPPRTKTQSIMFIS